MTELRTNYNLYFCTVLSNFLALQKSGVGCLLNTAVMNKHIMNTKV
jgi:hypothetical protein